MSTATVSELPFLDLGDETRVSGEGKFFGILDFALMLNDTELPIPFPFDNGTETKIYVSYIKGLSSREEACNSIVPSVTINSNCKMFPVRGQVHKHDLMRACESSTHCILLMSPSILLSAHEAKAKMAREQF